MVHLAVSVLGLTDATVGERVSGVVGIHAEVQVVAGVSHSQLKEGEEEESEATGRSLLFFFGLFFCSTTRVSSVIYNRWRGFML